MGYVARVSNPNNQDNPKVAGLLKYCIKHNHWSVFEQAHMTLEIETTRAIAAQILRHRSFTYQEFSQRYADSSMLASETPMFDLRRQDDKNRQNSIDDVDEFTKQELEVAIKRYFAEGMDLYQQMLRLGIAKECARMVLPLATPTRIYMTGSVRSWYITSSCVLLTVHRKNTWTLLTMQSVCSLNSSRLFLRHLDGNSKSKTQFHKCGKKFPAKK